MIERIALHRWRVVQRRNRLQLLICFGKGRQIVQPTNEDRIIKGAGHVFKMNKLPCHILSQQHVVCVALPQVSRQINVVGEGIPQIKQIGDRPAFFACKFSDKGIVSDDRVRDKDVSQSPHLSVLCRVRSTNGCEQIIHVDFALSIQKRGQVPVQSFFGDLLHEIALRFSDDKVRLAQAVEQIDRQFVFSGVRFQWGVVFTVIKKLNRDVRVILSEVIQRRVLHTVQSLGKGDFECLCFIL